MPYFNYYPSKRKKYKQNIETANIYNLWLQRLILLDSALYEWENLPSTIDMRRLELDLCYEGKVLFFKDEVIDAFFTLPVNFGGDKNINGIPFTRYAYSRFNSYHKTCNAFNSVIIMSNYLCFPHYLQLMDYAERLCRIERTINLNINAQKTPFFIATSEEQRLTMENLFQQYDRYEPLIMGTEDLVELSSFQVIQTQAPYLADRLDVLMHNTFNEALSFMGYNNSSQDKRERLVSAEVNGNNGIIKGQQNEGLISRKKACEEINALFNLNVGVKIRDNLQMPAIDSDNSYMYPLVNDNLTVKGKNNNGGT